MSHRNSATYEVKKAYLSSDFGYDIAVKWFGQEAIGKALYETNWSYNFKTKKSTPRNTLVSECGEDSVETWGSF